MTFPVVSADSDHRLLSLEPFGLRLGQSAILMPSQSLALGLTLIAAPQLVAPYPRVLTFPRSLAMIRLPSISRGVRELWQSPDPSFRRRQEFRNRRDWPAAFQTRALRCGPIPQNPATSCRPESTVSHRD